MSSIISAAVGGMMRSTGHMLDAVARVDFFLAARSLFAKDVHFQRRVQRRFLHTHDGSLTEEGLFVP